MKFRPLALPALAFASLLSAAEEPDPRIEAEKISARLVLDQETIMVGEPTYFSFVVKNASATDLLVEDGGDYQNGIGRPDSFKISVVGEDGESVPQLETKMNFGGMMSARPLPAGGGYAFELFLPHWATFSKPGTYTIDARRNLILGTGPARPDRWSRTKLPAAAQTTIHVVATDPERLGQLIEALGAQMLTERDSIHRRAPMKALQYIDDPRVIPHFVAALKTRDYSRMFEALIGLQKFKTDAAVKGLVFGAQVKPEDVGSPGPILDTLAMNIRLSAARALAENPHRDALGYLLLRQHDEYEEVRLTVVHVLGTKVEPAKAIPRLKELAQDRSQRVRDEARRYLREMGE